ncbi:hypothetical protein [Levilactobacillus namurensis]|uniref:Uncharacterized protein n=1 Tax=Levilactobacillus namurensis TaxID=380393 RepID=A0AAW8W2J1_9LACO|nr:hypothetical protein [Levilactobacillus namurensis]MCW3779143.1 hypothetical protein [Levilactobacillus namurensis]MDT7013020.1 hypothetical protein [Levilactobacillus namurensis]MDT7017729.1 hypothetical protein [Levilactobacillus namurensis]WNN65269.1 hypothetical protein RIN67_11360 [Levilactobacillus namurensis]
MQIGFNHHFYRHWPFWIGIGFLLGDAGLRLFGLVWRDPLGVSIGLMWLFIGIFMGPGGRPAKR